MLSVISEIIRYHESRKNSCLSTIHNVSMSEYIDYNLFDSLRKQYTLFTIEVFGDIVKITIPSAQKV